jgi:hypothetical protein
MLAAPAADDKDFCVAGHFGTFKGRGAAWGCQTGASEWHPRKAFTAGSWWTPAIASLSAA